MGSKRLRSGRVKPPNYVCLSLFRGLKYTVRSTSLPCRNAKFTSIELRHQEKDEIIVNANLVPILERAGESVRKSWFSNPWAHNLALVETTLSVIFGVRTHLTDKHFWPLSSST